MRARTLLAVVCCLLPVTSFAAEIKVLSAGATKPALAPLVETYAKQASDKVDVSYGTMGLLQEKLAAGERADVIVATVEVMADLEKQGKIVTGSRVPLGDIGVGVAVREGAPIPDISTPDAFKQTLLKAKSIVYVDPTKGTSGKHVAGVLQRLGIAEAVKSKTILREGGYAVEAVAKGDAEIGIQQTSEILPVKGVKLVGQLPGDLQKVTTYSAAIMSDAASPKPAQAFIRYLTGKEGRAVFVSKGFMAPRD